MCWFLYTAASIVMAATLIGFLGRCWWFFDLFSHFRAQYLWSLLLLAGVFSLGERWGWGILAALLAILNLCTILPLFRSGNPSEETHPQYRVLLANVNTANPHHRRVSSLVQTSSPDFIILIEVDEAWLVNLNLKGLGYTHELAVPRGDNYGLAIYSRYPIARTEIKYYRGTKRPSLAAQVRIDGLPLNILATHPPPPKSRKLARIRDSQIMALMAFSQGLDEAVLCCGDLNTTSWSAAYRNHLEQGGLVDSRQGSGIQGTWPTWMPLLKIPIDHIWISREVRVHRRRVGPKIGSDHLPVMLDFSIREMDTG